MKLNTIVERNQDDLTAAAQKLNKEVREFGEAELGGLVQDPSRAVDLIRYGMMAKEFIFQDSGWVQDFLEQWHLLNPDAVERIFEGVYREIMAKIQKQSRAVGSESTLSDLNMLHEGILSGIGGFLTKLAKMARLILQLLVASGGGVNNLNIRSERQLRVFNPYAVFRLTKDLQLASYRIAKQRQRP